MSGTPATNSLVYRQFLHGLFTGLLVLAIAGFFWVLLSAWSADCRRAGLVPWTHEDVPLHYVLWALPPAAIVLALLIAGAIGVRKKAQGFKSSDLSATSEVHRRMTRRIGRLFMLVCVIEWALCAASAIAGGYFHREELIWPAVSLAVSLHFLPLSRIFRNPPYMVTGVVGSIFSLALLLAPRSAVGSNLRVTLLGIAMSPVMWGTAIYVIPHAGKLARNWEIGVSS